MGVVLSSVRRRMREGRQDGAGQAEITWQSLVRFALAAAVVNFAESIQRPAQFCDVKNITAIEFSCPEVTVET